MILAFLLLLERVEDHVFNILFFCFIQCLVSFSSTFVSALSFVFIPNCVTEALSHPNWKAALEEVKGSRRSSTMKERPERHFFMAEEKSYKLLVEDVVFSMVERRAHRICFLLKVLENAQNFIGMAYGKAWCEDLQKNNLF